MKVKIMILFLLGSISYTLSTYGYQEVDGIRVRRCCTDADSNWYNAGPDREWREENIAPDNFNVYQRSNDRPISFADLSDDPARFEQSVYTSPK